ncbi:hypothetical protein CRG98_007980 [Punica granatum]|uniref:Uncharacterized protein n=1 Tax=Punica granatum TaxID=22663 RepID=A0A2I0KT58_PUNGR|nr:hypothetical protein CRG98_007980 [Punica granatum]
MERRRQQQQGFFSSLKTEVVRGLSPSRTRPATTMPGPGLLRCSNKNKQPHQSTYLDSLAQRTTGSPALGPLLEGPDPDDDPSRRSSSASTLGQWVKEQFSRTSSASASNKRSCDLRLMLGALGAPLAPVRVTSSDPLPLLRVMDAPMVSLSPNSFVWDNTYIKIPLSHDFCNSCIRLSWYNVAFIIIIIT